MKNILVVIVCALLGSYSTAQVQRPINDLARPSAGWDSLKSMIVYPEIARRAGVEGLSNVAVKLDTAGNVVDIMISGYDIFDTSIEGAIKKAAWLPEMDNGKARSTSVFFDVQFQYRNTKGPLKRILTIEADKTNAKPQK